ncbi:MAG: ABC transporter ATP-binding protein [Deltaproteobacteria bacterium]|jgi:oligopeptide/dipeptide ABC transporter ATP-binding protein|nr:ABC transporter ATP-binding protein [Deltaproteobacteria bacterium]
MLLQVENLSVGFRSVQPGTGTPRMARAVEEVSFCLDRGGSLCLVGESGCGKSVTALSLLGLLPSPPARLLGGRVLFEGEDMLRLPPEKLNRLRGGRIGMIFQEPMTSLNPVLKVGEQVAEPLIVHFGMRPAEALKRAVELLAEVGLNNPDRRAADYPHQLSGGMRQRVMIAMAMACRPSLLIADEPTTALDVSVQGQILDLMREMRESAGSALLMITHDLDVVARSADQVAVMYAGRIVESGPVGATLADPLHPYTAGLVASRPRLGWEQRSGLDVMRAKLVQARHGRLSAIPGTVPPPLERPDGCAFSTRCPQVFDRCRAEMPPLLPLTDGKVNEGRSCRCWLR